MVMYNTLRIYGVVRYFLWNSGLPVGAKSAITILLVAGIMAISYILGGFNFAIILSKKKFGTDVREYGSGNAGMTNMRRTFGKKAGTLVLLGDMGKTVVACLIGYLFLGRLGAYIAGLFCMMGHMFPAKYKFKGGKGVVCVATAILMTDIGNPSVYFIPFLFIILLGIFVVIVLGTKYISLGSIMCMLIYPVFLYSFEFMGEKAEDIATYQGKLDLGLYILIAFLMTAMVVFMHRENIVRLWHGEESKFDLHMSDKKALYNKENDDDTKNNSKKINKKK